jgi:tRNA U38,U39,U40 pseudouridine synthase TruA
MEGKITIGGEIYKQTKNDKLQNKIDIRDFCKTNHLWAAKDAKDNEWYTFAVKPTLYNNTMWRANTNKICNIKNIEIISVPDVPCAQSLVCPDGSMPFIEEKKPEKLDVRECCKKIKYGL